MHCKAFYTLKKSETRNRIALRKFDKHIVSHYLNSTFFYADNAQSVSPVSRKITSIFRIISVKSSKLYFQLFFFFFSPLLSIVKSQNTQPESA